MPATTRYSATFERTYEEDDPPPAPLMNRRSRSLSLQSESLTNGRAGFGPLFNGPTTSHTRSSSTEPEATSRAREFLAARTDNKVAVKAHNNPFQFVKVASCPMFKKPEDQMRKLQLAKPPAVKEEDEEEWQSNLDSWKSRRRKMSEGAFERQDELRRLQQEDVANEQDKLQLQQQKKIKKFSEMVEQRAHRGRAMSLCLLTSPLENSEWLFENSKQTENKSIQDIQSEESATSSNINSDEENGNFHKSDKNVNNGGKISTTNGVSNNHNGIQNSTSNSSISRNSDLSELDVSQESILSNKDHIAGGNGFIDSGLESLSSSHRAGDVPDSGSDFSQDSGSSIDCDSPRVSGLITTGIELLEEYSSKEEREKCDKEKPKITLPVEKEKSKSSEVEKKVKTVTKKNINKEKTDKKIITKSKDKPSAKPETDTQLKSSVGKNVQSIDSENEMFVDDFEELARIKTAENSKPSSKSEVSRKCASKMDTSLNVVYQSPGKNMPKSENTNGLSSSVPKKKENDFHLISEIPVDKVTEEMERLILEQLEQEEQAKEISMNGKFSNMCDDKSVLELPVRNIEPPKEKPPPPPSTTPATTPKKEPCVKRVNSTKRILKEINKRRTDFLGIDNSKGDMTSSELSLAPPPAMEDILRAEREHSRMTRQTLENAASLASSTEEEMARKEREIIESVEKEERLKLNEEEKPTVPDFTNARAEEEKLKKLMEERKKKEEELKLAEAKKARLEEEVLLQKREDQVKKQEAVVPAPKSIDKDADKGNDVKSETTECNVNLVPQNGDGFTNQCSVPPSVESEACVSKKSPPTPPPKPVKKKKEALRKERERLRQEQEELQREREEHRKKIQLEQEELKKNEAHVPVVPMSRVGPPIPEKPVLSPQVLTSSSSSQSISSSLSNVSREVPHPALSNNAKIAAAPSTMSDNLSPTQSKPNAVKLRAPGPRPKVMTNETRPAAKAPLLRKQDLPEPRYNQNHWLIQEAEMRRIAEQKERQRIQSNASHFKDYAEVMAPLHRPNYAQNMTMKSGYPAHGLVCAPDQRYGQQYNHSPQTNKCIPPAPQHMDSSHYLATYSKHFEPNMVPPAKPCRVNPHEKQEQMLSVSGRKRCSHCGDELGRGAAMIIESLQLYYHIHCFRCCVCQTQLGNGSCGTDVRVRNNKLHCHNCYSNDEAGLKFSQV